jgi:hypothetical protein
MPNVQEPQISKRPIYRTSKNGGAVIQQSALIAEV